MIGLAHHRHPPSIEEIDDELRAARVDDSLGNAERERELDVLLDLRLEAMAREARAAGA